MHQHQWCGCRADGDVWPAGTVAVPPPFQVTVIGVLSVLVTLNQYLVTAPLASTELHTADHGEDRIAIGLHDDVGLRQAVDAQRDGVGTVSQRADHDGQRLAGVQHVVGAVDREDDVEVVAGLPISTVTVSSKSAHAWA